MPHRKILLALCTLAITAAPALAWHVDGNVHCDANGLPINNITVKAVSSDGAGFTGTAVTDDAGYYFISLPEASGCFNVSVMLGAGDTPVAPATGAFDFCTTNSDYLISRSFTITGASCGNEGCWLTAGGAKFEPVDKTLSGTNGPDDSWGGNVYPGCSSTAGDGGQWNHVAHARKLHFQGRAITVVRCGNVDGIPAGSTSPVTPYNFIEFTGTGTLKGIEGNKADYGTVYFFARCEDRNEPGSAGQRDGAAKDRYFLNVYTNPADPAGSSVLLEDVDGNPATVDPVTITDGNMQIHVSSCSTPPVLGSTTKGKNVALRGGSGQPIASSRDAGTLWFASPSPSPARGRTNLSFGLPKDADVSMTAFDVSGRQVHQFAAGRIGAGTHSFDWNLRDDMGRPLGVGVYFVRLVVDGSAQTHPVVVMP